MHREISPDLNATPPLAEAPTRQDPGAAIAPAAAIAHELTQPLTAIINSLNAARRLLAAREGPENRLLREILEEALEQSQVASRLVRSLRDSPRRPRAADPDLVAVPARST
jgi:phosphoglycerate-specific signal transduction histidine kinase